MICRTLRKLLKRIATVCQYVNWLSELPDMKIIPGHNYFVHELYKSRIVNDLHLILNLWMYMLNKLCMLHTQNIQIKKTYIALKMKSVYSFGLHVKQQH